MFLQKRPNSALRNGGAGRSSTHSALCAGPNSARDGRPRAHSTILLVTRLLLLGSSTDRPGAVDEVQLAYRPDRAVIMGAMKLRPSYAPLAAPKFHIPWHRSSVTATPYSFPFCAAAMRNAWIPRALRFMPIAPAASRRLSQWKSYGMTLIVPPHIDRSFRQLYLWRMPISDAEDQQYLGSTPFARIFTSAALKLGSKETEGVRKSWPSHWQSVKIASGSAPSKQSQWSTWAIEPSQ